MQYIEPYNDDYMIYNKLTGRYILTEKAFTDFGYNLRAQIVRSGTANPENIISGFFRTVSDMVYGYIHRFGDNVQKDRLIAGLQSLRDIILQAMLYQAAYVYLNGNLLLSTDDNERKKAIDQMCIDILSTIVPELHNSILYAGR